MLDERKIVKFLIDYHSCDELSHQEKIDSVKEGVERGNFFRFVSKKIYGKSLKKITKNNREEWRKIRYLIDECLEDNYIKEETRYVVTVAANDLLNIKERKEPKGEYIFLTSKGKKLARWYYFYLKFLPEEFGDLKIFLIAVLGTIVTSPIWQPVLSFISSAIKTIYKQGF